SSRVTPVALPSGPVAPATPDGKPAARPIAGPVMPLTVTPGNEELLGGAGNSAPHADAIATRVLVKGEPVSAPRGRADDFALQHSNDDSPDLPTPAGALVSTPPEPVAPEQPPAEKKSSAPKSSVADRTAQNAQNRQSTPNTQNAGIRPRPPR